MNKRVMVFIVVILLIIAGGIVYLLTSNAADKDKQEMLTENGIEVPSSNDQLIVSAGAGAYIDYTPTAISEASGTKLLFFYAPWCPQCRALEADIKSKTVPDGVTIIKIDYDTNQSLRQKYGVTIQTTLVKVDDSGNLIEKYVAYEEPTLAAVVANLL